MGYLPAKFKKKQGSVVAPSTSIKTGKTITKMPDAETNNPSVRNKVGALRFIGKTV